MKTPATLIAAVALLLVTEAAIFFPAPGIAGDLSAPAPETRKVMPKLGNYLLFQHNGYTSSLLGEFNTLPFL
jgi:hypothetical protein